MHSESGWLDDFGNAFVVIRLADRAPIECLIDTGFNGDLVLPSILFETLKFRSLGSADCVLVGGIIMPALTSIAEIEWLGTRRQVEVVSSDGTDQLIGTQLLRGTRLKIDYVDHTVAIEEP